MATNLHYKRRIDDQKSNLWELAGMASGGLSVYGAGGGVYLFHLVNRETHRGHRFELLTSGAAGGALAFSASGASDYVSFRLPHKVNFMDFDGISMQVYERDWGIYSTVHLVFMGGHLEIAGFGLNIPGKSLMKGHVNILFGDGRPLGASDLQIKSPEERLPPGPVKKIQKNDRVTYRIPQEILFDFDKYELKITPGRLRIYNALELIGNEMGGVTYTGNDRYLVVGHTDSIGKDKYNRELSLKRAKTVANWFITHNKTRREYIKAIGEGKSNPIDTNETVWGRANNRRVEVEVIRKDLWESL